MNLLLLNAALVALVAQTNLNTRILAGEKVETYWDIMMDSEQLAPYVLLVASWQERMVGMDRIRWPDERLATELATNLRKTPMMGIFSPPARLAMARVFVLYVRMHE